jgi:hypothetical protein
MSGLLIDENILNYAGKIRGEFTGDRCPPRLTFRKGVLEENQSHKYYHFIFSQVKISDWKITDTCQYSNITYNTVLPADSISRLLDETGPGDNITIPYMNNAIFEEKQDEFARLPLCKPTPEMMKTYDNLLASLYSRGFHLIDNRCELLLPMTKIQLCNFGGHRNSFDADEHDYGALIESHKLDGKKVLFIFNDNEGEWNKHRKNSENGAKCSKCEDGGGNAKWRSYQDDKFATIKMIGFPTGTYLRKNKNLNGGYLSSEMDHASSLLANALDTIRKMIIEHKPEIIYISSDDDYVFKPAFNIFRSCEEFKQLTKRDIPKMLFDCLAKLNNLL